MMYRPNTKAFTLIELLIAMAISSILLLGVGTIYSSSKRSYFVQDEFGRLQENARFALQHLAKEIRMTGYQGCKGLSYLTPRNIVKNTAQAGGIDINPANFLEGHGYASGSWNPPFPVTPASGLITTSDAFTIRGTSECGGHLTGQVDANNANVKVISNCGFQKDEVVMITDCENADIFQITNNPNDSGNGSTITLTHANNNNTSNKLSKVYGPNAKVVKYKRNTYYIKTDPITNNPSLYVMSLGVVGGALTTVETQIADNIEAMLIDYGVDMDFKFGKDNLRPGAERFLTAAQLQALGTDPDPQSNFPYWANVVSMRIRLLVSSNDVTNRIRNYVWNGATVTPADNRMRHAYTMTINLRNRTP